MRHFCPAVLVMAAYLGSTPLVSAEGSSASDVDSVPAALQADKQDNLPAGDLGQEVEVLKMTDEARAGNKNPDAEIATMTGEPADSVAVAAEEEIPKDKEQVWSEISQAISGLNDMVGDKMFRDLRRLENNRMEVRVDQEFWRRVRYETRVDLKNDISNIWHLYVLQYTDDEDSSVYFVDDKTNKTIDIFSQFR